MKLMSSPKTIKKRDENKYPATCVVHWPSGPVNCCDNHARAAGKTIEEFFETL